MLQQEGGFSCILKKPKVDSPRPLFGGGLKEDS